MAVAISGSLTRYPHAAGGDRDHGHRQAFLTKPAVRYFLLILDLIAFDHN